MNRVTARWESCFLIGIDDIVDLIEANNESYFYVIPSVTNEQLESLWSGSSAVGGSTISEITALKDPLGVLRIIENRNPDWIYICSVCECGGDKLNITHSNWCPKYTG